MGASERASVCVSLGPVPGAAEDPCLLSCVTLAAGADRGAELLSLTLLPCSPCSARSVAISGPFTSSLSSPASPHLQEGQALSSSQVSWAAGSLPCLACGPLGETGGPLNMHSAPLRWGGSE